MDEELLGVAVRRSKGVPSVVHATIRSRRLYCSVNWSRLARYESLALKASQDTGAMQRATNDRAGDVDPGM